MNIKNESGQIIVILLLIMLLVLSVVLAVTQRSTTDLSTSTQTEQSTRAYSAAEAGLEQALQNGGATPIGNTSIPLGNNASAVIKNSGLQPVKGSNAAIEYFPIGKETPAQIWLLDPNAPTDITKNYNRNSFTVYFGNPTVNGAYDDASGSPKNITPAIEVSIVFKLVAGTSITYQNQKFYFDPLVTRRSSNSFSAPTSSCSSGAGYSLTTILSANSGFYCKTDVLIQNCQLPNCIPQQVRVRLLYANQNQKLAFAPASGGSFPPQVELYNATGKAGASEKTLQIFRIKDMIPPWLDYAIFSYNDIIK